MNTVGEQIGKYRKKNGLTQEGLAAVIGVSAQSISKWETNTTMPDILLLPIIADFFGISIDELFRETSRPSTGIAMDDLPEAAFDILLQTMQRAWDSEGTAASEEERAANVKEALIANPSLQTAIYSEKGGAVYANHELGILFRKTDEPLYKLLQCKPAAELLADLANASVRRILDYQIHNNGTAYTAASASAKLGMEQADVEAALQILLKYNLTARQEADLGDDHIVLYHFYNGERLLLIDSILRLARRIATYSECYRGFRGNPSWGC